MKFKGLSSNVLKIIACFCMVIDHIIGTVGQALMFLIPFSHPMMAMDNLIFGDMSIVLFGIAYLVVFDIIMILITVRIYNSDILITGLGQNKTVVRIQRIFTKRGEHEDE